VGSTCQKDLGDPWNRDLEGKFRSPTKIGVHLEALLEIIFLSAPLKTMIRTLI
jgi:hypothetical protein